MILRTHVLFLIMLLNFSAIIAMEKQLKWDAPDAAAERDYVSEEMRKTHDLYHKGAQSFQAHSSQSNSPETNELAFSRYIIKNVTMPSDDPYFNYSEYLEKHKRESYVLTHQDYLILAAESRIREIYIIRALGAEQGNPKQTINL